MAKSMVGGKGTGQSRTLPTTGLLVFWVGAAGRIVLRSALVAGLAVVASGAVDTGSNPLLQFFDVELFYVVLYLVEVGLFFVSHTISLPFLMTGWSVGDVLFCSTYRWSSTVCRLSWCLLAD